MAPKARKSAPKGDAAVETPAKPASTTPKVSKRKATEDASPTTVKRQAVEAPVEELKKTRKSRKEPTPAQAEEADVDAEEKTKSAIKSKKPAKSRKKSQTPIKVAADDENSFSEDEDDQSRTLAHDLDDAEDDVRPEKDTFQPGQDVGKVPKPESSSTKRKSQTSTPNGTTSSKHQGTGVLYIGRLPHGFFEHEMRSYFGQFGKIINLRMSRNKRTGASKHYAFVEFEEESTAEIVAKTMDNYLLFGHILKCKMIPPSQVHDELFKGANRRFKKIPRNKMEGKALERPQTETQWNERISREERRRSARAEKLKAIGYDFNSPSLKQAQAIEAPPAEEKTKAVDASAQDEEVKAIEAAPEAPGEEVVAMNGVKGTKSKKSKAKKGKAS